MRYLIFFILLVGCTSESTLIKEVERRLHYEKLCNDIGKDLNVRVTFTTDYTDGYGCNLHHAQFQIPYHLFEFELKSINRYFDIKNRIKK